MKTTNIYVSFSMNSQLSYQAYLNAAFIKASAELFNVNL